MIRIIRCDCGFTARGDSDEELVVNARAHAGDVHGMNVTRQQVLSLAVPADAGR